MRNILGAIALSFLGSTAFGADLKASAAPTAVYVPCTINQCSGFFGGFNVEGTGSGLGSGLASNGGGLGLQGGYQYWDSRLYFAAEVFGDYVFQNGATAIAGGPTINPGYMFGEFVDLGLPLSSLFGTTPSAPGTLPASILASTLSPYVKLGAVERKWGAAWATGAGMAFDISARWFGKIDYIHAVYSNTTDAAGASIQKTDDIVKLSVNYKFTN